MMCSEAAVSAGRPAFRPGPCGRWAGRADRLKMRHKKQILRNSLLPVFFSFVLCGHYLYGLDYVSWLANDRQQRVSLFLVAPAAL